MKNIQIGNITPAAKQLQLGDLSGNHFSITLRLVCGQWKHVFYEEFVSCACWQMVAVETQLCHCIIMQLINLLQINPSISKSILVELVMRLTWCVCESDIVLKPRSFQGCRRIGQKWNRENDAFIFKLRIHKLFWHATLWNVNCANIRGWKSFAGVSLVRGGNPHLVLCWCGPRYAMVSRLFLNRYSA